MGVFDFGPDADSIKSALADLDLADLEVEVDEEGHVTLSGIAGTQRAADKAVGIVSATDGVESVTNNLEVSEDDEDSSGGGGGHIHTTVAGDTLYGIAQKYYGDGNRYMEIFEANRAIWKNYGDNPNNIYVGWELVIP